MAETMGFEPMIPFSRYAHLANECLQPLGHVSTGSICLTRSLAASRMGAFGLSAGQMGLAFRLAEEFLFVSLDVPVPRSLPDSRLIMCVHYR